MIASSWWKVGIGLVGVAGILATAGTGCGSGTSGAGSTSTSAGGGTSGTGGATAGTGGDTTTSGTTTGGMTTTGGTTTSTGSTTSSTGTGMSAYADCSECTAIATGAPSKECKATHDTCFGNKNCVQIYNCVYDPNNGCTTDAAGACCVYACYDALKVTLGNDAAALQKAIDDFHADDDCLYCTTCKSLCSADAYCTAYAAGPATCGG
jgi:hypothetical protein